MSRHVLFNAACVLVIALVLGCAHLLGPSELEAAQAVADDSRSAPMEVASVLRSESADGPGPVPH